MKEQKQESITTREEALAYGLSFPGTYKEMPFRDTNWQLVRVAGSKKAFLWTYEREGYINLNVKVDPQWRDFWRSAYPAVIPGWHQNKEHWNTIILNGSIPAVDIKRMIAESYDLVTDSPTKRIYEAAKKIPRGKVATYGQVAELAGDKKMARAVGNASQKSGSRGDPVLPRGERKGRACRRVCVWRSRKAGRSAPRGWDRGG